MATVCRRARKMERVSGIKRTAPRSQPRVTGGRRDVIGVRTLGATARDQQRRARQQHREQLGREPETGNTGTGGLDMKPDRGRQMSFIGQIGVRPPASSRPLIAAAWTNRAVGAQ
jgi:hypothetical protein